jgi:hypothetical protein
VRRPGTVVATASRGKTGPTTSATRRARCSRSLAQDLLFNRLIGKPINSDVGSCVASSGVFGEKGLIDAQLIESLHLSTIRASEAAGKEAADEVSALLRSKLAAGFGAVETQFRAAFETTLRERLSGSASTNIEYEWWRLQLVDAFKDRAETPFATAFPIFEPCKGKKLVVGAVGYVVKALSAGNQAQAATDVQKAIDGAFEASAGILPKLTAEITTAAKAIAKASVNRTINISYSQGDPRFFIVWYLAKEVPTPASKQAKAGAPK